MCSATSGALRFELSQPANLSNFSEDSFPDWSVALITLFSHIAAYLGLLVIIGIVTLIILKFVFDLRRNGDFDEENHNNNIRPAEINPLLPPKATSFRYGTWTENDDDDDDLGAGNGKEDSDEGNVCVICYDEQRNCFFVPCGHCATCHGCALRIYDGESKACPLCRRIIGKVNKIIGM